MEPNPLVPKKPQAGDPFELAICGVKAVFRYCPPGTFLMGSPEEPSEEEKRRNVGIKSIRDLWLEVDWGSFLHRKQIDKSDERPRREVTLTRGFWLLETPVTQVLWEATTGWNPSYYAGDGARPVENVCWHDSVEYINNLNAKGFAPDGMKFDLPTEAEWEYACGAKTTTDYNVGDELSATDANIARVVDETTPVRSYAPNAWGFYDMHGNVYEWCFDWYGAYSTTPTTDPKGAPEGEKRVLRGGSWYADSGFCRTTSRYALDPSEKSHGEDFVEYAIVRWSDRRLLARLLSSLYSIPLPDPRGVGFRLVLRDAEWRESFASELV